MWKLRICATLMAVVVLAGCSKVKLTTGLSGDEFARIAGQEVDMQIANVLLAESKYSYEQMFNDQVWSKEINGTTTEEHVKNSVRDTVESIVYGKNMAEELNITVTADEQEKIQEAAAAYMADLKNSDCSFDVSGVEQFYEWLLLAEKGFYAVTDEVDTKVSTDEARLIQVQYVYLHDDEDGRDTANQIIEKLAEGKEFAALAMEYSDDSNYNLELSMGEYIKEFEEQAFSLDSGETSGIVETEYGFYIIKCTNYNLECDFDTQAEKVVFSRRKEIFTEKYLEYANNQTLEFNRDFWNKNPMDEVCKGSGKLYEIYKSYFT